MPAKSSPVCVDCGREFSPRLPHQVRCAACTLARLEAPREQEED